MTCKQIGDNAPGTCDSMIMAETAEEMGAKGSAHAAEAHPELKERMSHLSPDERKAWSEGLKQRFDAEPEM